MISIKGKSANRLLRLREKDVIYYWYIHIYIIYIYILSPKFAAFSMSKKSHSVWKVFIDRSDIAKKARGKNRERLFKARTQFCFALIVRKQKITKEKEIDAFSSLSQFSTKNLWSISWMQIQLCQFCDPTDKYLPSNHIIKLSICKNNALY